MNTHWLIVLSFSIFGCASNNSETIQFERNSTLDTTAIQPAEEIIKPLENPSLSELMDSNKFIPTDVSILIDKSDFRLNVLIKDSLIKSYRVVFGGNQKDDKLRQGDSCTPEGKFKIRSKYPHKAWSTFIWVDYPNANSWKKHNAAKANKTIPANSKIGGEIGIHGVPFGMNYLVSDTINWTAGCICLTTEDLNEIYPYFHKNIWVEIRK